MAGMLRSRLRPHSNHRSNSHLAAEINDQVKLFLLLQNNDGIESQLPGSEGEGNVLSILEAVADDEGFAITFAQSAHEHEKVRLGARLEAESERRTESDNVLHHEPVLVAFHRVNPLVVRPIA